MTDHARENESSVLRPGETAEQDRERIRAMSETHDQATSELLEVLDELYPLSDDARRVERAGRTAFVLKRWMAVRTAELEALVPALIEQVWSTVRTTRAVDAEIPKSESGTVPNGAPDPSSSVLRPGETAEQEDDDLTRQFPASTAPDMGISAIPPETAPNDWINCRICRQQNSFSGIGHWAWHKFCVNEINPIALIQFIEQNGNADAADKILRYVVAITGMDLKAVRAALDRDER